jgi:hypothetical protein
MVDYWDLSQITGMVSTGTVITGIVGQHCPRHGSSFNHHHEFAIIAMISDDCKLEPCRGQC